MGRRAIAASDQAKSDNSRAQVWILRQPGGILRATDRNLRGGYRILRFGDRILRESSTNNDSLPPICSMYVLFVFLHSSFALALESNLE